MKIKMILFALVCAVVFVGCCSICRQRQRNAKPLRGEAAYAVCLRNREKGILEKCSECLRDASTEVGEGALSQVVLRFAGRVDILDLTPCWKGRCWGWGQWLVE